MVALFSIYRVFGVKWFKFKHNFCFCKGNRFSKLNNYRQVVIGEEQLEVLGVNVIEEVSDFLIHHVAEAIVIEEGKLCLVRNNLRCLGGLHCRCGG